MAFVTNITSVTSSINSVSNLSRTLDSVFEEAQLTGLLSLSGRNLKEFPTISSRFDLSDTVEADLSKNRFVEFPVHLAEYISLEALHLCNNCIRSIPIAVQHLQSLTYLDLSRNYLRWIPPELCLLPLEVLLLRNNCLSLLPREIYMTSNTLMELDVSCNKLETLPNEIGAMKALRVLNVRENLLKELPSELCSLSLRVLDLASNQITHLNVDLKKMITLVTLELSDNPLSFPPLKICRKGRAHVFKSLEIESIKRSRPLRHLNGLDTYKRSSSTSRTNPKSRLIPTNPEDCKYALESRLDCRKSRHHTIAADSGYSTMTEENGKSAGTPPSNGIHDISTQHVATPHLIADSSSANFKNNSTKSTHSPKTMSQSLYVPLGKNLNGSIAVNTDDHPSQSTSFVDDVISACNKRMEARNFDLGGNLAYYQSSVLQNSIVSNTVVANRRALNKTIRQNGHHYYQNGANYGVIKENTKTSVCPMDVLKDEDEKCDETVFIFPSKVGNESPSISNRAIIPNFDPPLLSQINDSSNLLPANTRHCENFMAESLKEQRQQCDTFVEGSFSRSNKLCSAVTLPEKSGDKTSASFASIMSKLALKSEKCIHLPAAETGSSTDEKNSYSEQQQSKTVNGKVLQPKINGDSRLSNHAKCDNQPISLASFNNEVKIPKPVTAARMARCSISSSSSSVNSVNIPRGRSVASKISPSAKQPTCSKTSGGPGSNETKSIAMPATNRLKTSPSASSSLNRAKVSPPNSYMLKKHSVPNGLPENAHLTPAMRKSPSESQTLKKVSPNTTSALEKQQKMCEDICKIFRDKLNVELPSDPAKLGEALSDGVYLCNYLNHLRPKTIKNIHVANGAAPKITMVRRNVESFLMGCRRYGVIEVLLANNQTFPAWISDQLIVSLPRDNENRSLFEFIKDLALTNHSGFAEIIITILFILENGQSGVVKLDKEHIFSALGLVLFIFTTLFVLLFC